MAKKSSNRHRILLLGNCANEFISTDPRGIFEISSNLQETLRNSEIPDIDADRFDLVVMMLSLRNILVEATGLSTGRSDFILTRLNGNLQVETLLTNCLENITFLLDRLHQKVPALPVFVTSIFVPGFNFLGDLVGRNNLAEPRNFLRRLNENIYASLKPYNNFYFIDTNEIITIVGGQRLRDDRFYWTSHAGFLSASVWLGLEDDFLYSFPYEHADVHEMDMRRFRIELWSKISTMLSIIRQENQIKMIIVDLDDTLWRGIAAEDNMQPSQRIEGWPLGFVEALLYFRKRGGLLAICSKNDLDPTLARIATIWSGALQPKDFASIRINWQPKPENIAEILAETMVLPENTLFIDDNPREIDEVQARFAGMECMGPPQEKWRQIILQDARFQTPVITKESKERTKLVQARVERAKIAQNMTREEWLRSLNIHQKIYVISEPRQEKIVRIIELLNKTNQFNTTGKRWEASEFDDFFANGGVCVASAVRDKTADNGIVGVALVMGAEIIQVVLSCRVFGLGVEIALGSIATKIALQKSEIAQAKWIDTGKNFTCHDFFDKIGFNNHGNFYVSQKACDVTDWITLEFDEQKIWNSMRE